MQKCSGKPRMNLLKQLSSVDTGIGGVLSYDRP